MTLYTDWKPGLSLDALNDILYSGFGKRPLRLIWENSAKSASDLGLAATLRFYEDKIIQGKPYNTELAQQKIADLKNGEGQTLFEIIVEILEDHKQIALLLN